MKPPQQLANEKAMEIAKELRTDKSVDGDVARIVYSKRLAAHLLPLYECVEQRDKLIDGLTKLDWCIGYELTADNHTQLDKVRGYAFDLKEALSNLSTPTTEKKEGGNPYIIRAADGTEFIGEDR